MGMGNLIYLKYWGRGSHSGSDWYHWHDGEDYVVEAIASEGSSCAVSTRFECIDRDSGRVGSQGI
jgi:hypothetical protein